jgi:hypothetical protein
MDTMAELLLPWTHKHAQVKSPADGGEQREAGNDGCKRAESSTVS